MAEGLAGLRVLVTGASRGIGAAVARALLDAGARVALCGRDEAALAAVAGERGFPVPGELAVAEERDAVVDRAARELGGLDALVLSAGIAEHAAFEALGEDALRLQLEVNLVAPLMMARRALPQLREGRGRVVFLGSTLADRPAPGTLAYTASKAALHAATRALAAELAPAVTVNAVAPGVVDTAMVRRPRTEPGEAAPEGEALKRYVEAQLEGLRALHPLGRLGTPEDIADAVLHLLDAPWTTGTILTVDGGLTAR